MHGLIIIFIFINYLFADYFDLKNTEDSKDPYSEENTKNFLQEEEKKIFNRISTRIAGRRGKQRLLSSSPLGMLCVRNL